MRLNDVQVIAWDFDGVLNKNIENGAFVWSRDFERDLGLPLQDFHNYLFRGRFHQAMRGTGDLKSFVADWLSTHNTHHSAQDILTYWFDRDALPDPKMLTYLEHLKRHNQINIIATNNEVHRADYIEHAMGFGPLVDRIFAAGRMRLVKPDRAYFKHIEYELQLPPQAFLLIDDMSENVEAAHHAGWAAHHHREQQYKELEQVLGL